MLPSHYMQPQAARVKRSVAKVRHISAPLKGLSLSSKLVQGDPLTATVLDNWVVEENQIKARPGYVLRYADVDVQPVETLVPYYGDPNKLAAALAGKLVLLDGSLVHDGFTSNDWSWTAFSDLSSTDYTVMVNGRDGVWSWNGGANVDPAPVAVIALDNTNPARCTVSPADIGKFTNSMTVVIAGATGAHAAANGPHVITLVGAAAPNSFDLIGVDLSAAGSPQVGGVTADPPGSMVKETITPKPSDPWIVPDQFNIVLAHMNRLFFADSSNLAVYYLPLQQKSNAGGVGDELGVLPLNAVFRRGGTIRAMASWTTEGAVNLNDQLVIFSSNGEAVIYGGTDPNTDFTLSGIFRFDTPMSKHSVVNYGGDLYVLISTGLVPMTTLMRAESEQLGQRDRDVFSAFFNTATRYRDRPGWEAFVNPSSGRLIANLPQGSKNSYSQMVRFMPNPIWATWSALPSRCWGWVDNRLYFGSDDGRVYEMHANFLNDKGDPIKVDVQMAWQNFGTPAIKHFKMILPYLQTDGTPQPFVDIKVDYDMTDPQNQPDITYANAGATWDLATWNEDFWAQPVRGHNNWTGTGDLGRVGAPRLMALLRDCEFALTGWDVMYDTGSVLG